MFKHISTKKFTEENWSQIYLGQDPDLDVFESRIRMRDPVKNRPDPQHCFELAVIME
jgi:hypothetical protein